MTKKTLLAITAGDPASIGPEITLKSFAMENLWQYGVPLVCADLKVMDEVCRKLEIPVSVVPVRNATEASELSGEINGKPVVPILDQRVITDVSNLKVGKVDALAGQAAVSYIQAAVDLCKAGYANGICTAPINKEAIRAAGFHYIGHTEMISEMSNGRKGFTEFQVDKMNIFFHSRHVSLRQAIDLAKKELLLESIEAACDCLSMIGIVNPHLAMAGLNPHSSDGGLFGDEEALEIKPAVDEAKRRGIDIVGPIPADSVFHHAAEGHYDAVISLYHDQGHIAAKSYSFYRVVSVTFGYPFIRTSVDHGTAFDIAWQGIANPVSMKEAILKGFELAPKYRY